MGHLPTPTSDRQPRQLQVREDNHLQVFMGTKGLEYFGKRLLNKSDGNNEDTYHVDVIMALLCVQKTYH